MTRYYIAWAVALFVLIGLFAIVVAVGTVVYTVTHAVIVGGIGPALIPHGLSHWSMGL